MNLQVLFLTRYDQRGPSSRVRSLQLIDFLKAHNIEADWSPLLSNEYLTHRFNGKIHWQSVMQGCMRRVKERLSSRSYDVYVVEKELIPWIPFAIERLLWPDCSRTIVDYDDAVFHSYDLGGAVRKYLLGDKIRKVMSTAAAVTVGNEYLAAYARSAGAKPDIVRSSVDCDHYVPASCASVDRFTIGWVGSPITAKFLEQVQEPLEWAIKTMDARLLLVGAGNSPLAAIGAEIVPWSIETEVALVQSMDVGIMPLPDSPFERGKCGYKLIQYMACGKPVIASPVGINSEIVTAGFNGFLPLTASDWKNAFKSVYDDPPMARAMGSCGRERAVSEYSAAVSAAALAAVIQRVAKQHVRSGT